MSFGLLIFGIVISVIAMLTTLILSIISLATGKQRSGIIYGVAFIMSLVLAVLCIAETAKRGSDKMKEGISWLQEFDKKNKSQWNSSDNEENYYGYIPEGNKDTIANAFYNSSEDGIYYTPLVFPYRFASADMFMNVAYLEMMKGDSAIRPSEGDSCFGRLQYISHYTFDDQFLLAKRDNKELRENEREWKDKDIPDYTFILFEFSTGKCEEFWREDKLLEKAKILGFHGKNWMDMSTTHYLTYTSEEGD